jgi:RNA polymerase sigma factor (sigma-70 family)
MTVARPVSRWRLRPGGRVQAPPPGFRHRPRAAAHAERARAAPSLRPVGTASDELGQARFEDLVPRAVAGDRGAWEALVSRLQRVAWRSIAGFDLGAEDRKDAFAATFFRLNERLSTIREPAKLPGWVATTARNEVHTLLRARRRLRSTDPHDMPPIVQPDVGPEQVVEDELRSAVRRGFQALSDRCQELLRLVTLDPPLSYAEVGDLLGMPHGSIGPTRARCLDQLRGTAALRPYVTGR